MPEDLSPIAELDSAYNVTAEFVGSLMIKNCNTYQLIIDHLGSVRLVVDINCGAVVHSKWNMMSLEMCFQIPTQIFNHLHMLVDCMTSQTKLVQIW